MTQIRFGRLIVLACMGLAVACTSGTDGGTAGNTELNLDIVNPGGTSGELGFSIDRVDYRITCAGNPPGTYPIPPADTNGTDYDYNDSVDISGAFEVIDTRVPPVWQAVMDLPPGDCTITLSVYEDDEIVCVGSQTLAIAEDATTKYDIVLVCSLSIDTPDGMADVDGTFEFITGNLCPKLYVLNAIPSGQPGNEIPQDPVTTIASTEIQYRAKDPDNSCGNNCDPQSCTTANPPVCTPYPSNINDPNCNPAAGGDPNSAACQAGDHAGLVCTIAALPSATPGVPGGTFISPADGVTPVGPVLPVNLNTASAAAQALGLVLPGLGGPAGTNAEDSPAYPGVPNLNGSLPPLVYQCDITLPGPVLLNLTCSDGDLECDQTKQITVFCPGNNFCISDPVDCSAPAGSCITGGTCQANCDPLDLAGPACTGPAGNERCAGYGNPVTDGTACTEGGGQVCSGGACVECLADADCINLPAPPVDCQLPNTCDVGTNTCVAGGVAPLGTPCSNGECTGNGIGPAECAFVAIPQGPFQEDITLACTNNLTPDISILPWQLVAGVNSPFIVDGDPVTMDFTGTAFFTETFLDAGLAAVPGLSQAALATGNRGGATIVEYGGGLTGPDVEIEPAPIPTTCNGGMLAGDPCTVDSDCPPVGYFQCQEIVQLPTIDGTGDACAACNALGPPKDTQCADNGYCIAGPLPLPLDTVTGNYTAVGGNPINLGWVDTNNLGLNVDGTYILPAASFPTPWQPAGLRVVVGVLQIALNCNMAVDSGGPLGVGVPDLSSPTPTSALLNDFVVQVP